MSRLIKHKTKNIFLSLKQCLIGRINDTDIKLLKQRFKDFELHRYKVIQWYTGYAKQIYYNTTKDSDFPANKQWLRIKKTLDTADYYLIGTTNDNYTHYGKELTCYKYFRYYHDYSILELVSDYYNKIPIFYHLSNTGEYNIINGIECIPIIDDCYLRFLSL